MWWAILSDKWVNRCQQICFLHHAAGSPKHFALSEQHQSRHRLYAILACRGTIHVHINLDDTDALAQHFFYLLENGVHQLAWLAPCGVEIDQYELATVDYIVECFHVFCPL